MQWSWRGSAYVISNLFSEIPLECVCNINLFGFQNEMYSINTALYNYSHVNAHSNKSQNACNTCNQENNFCRKEKASLSFSVITWNKHAERNTLLTISLLQHKGREITHQLRCTNSSKSFSALLTWKKTQRACEQTRNVCSCFPKNLETKHSRGSACSY